MTKYPLPKLYTIPGFLTYQMMYDASESLLQNKGSQSYPNLDSYRSLIVIVGSGRASGVISAFTLPYYPECPRVDASIKAS